MEEEKWKEEDQWGEEEDGRYSWAGEADGDWRPQSGEWALVKMEMY